MAEQFREFRQEGAQGNPTGARKPKNKNNKVSSYIMLGVAVVFFVILLMPTNSAKGFCILVLSLLTLTNSKLLLAPDIKRSFMKI